MKRKLLTAVIIIAAASLTSCITIYRNSVVNEYRGSAEITKDSLNIKLLNDVRKYAVI